MPITLNLQPELLQAITALNLGQSIDEIVEQALRDYLQQHTLAQSSLGFGESLLLFRQVHNLDREDFDPDEIWADVRDRHFTGHEVTFE